MHLITDIKIDLPDIDLESSSILRIFFDKSWQAEDFANLFTSIEIVYKTKFWTHKAIRATSDYISKSNYEKTSFMEFRHTPLAFLLAEIKNSLEHLKGGTTSTELHIDTSYHKIMRSPSLSVKKIEFASPGFTDLLGISGILKEIKEALMYYIPNKSDKEKAKILEQQRVNLEIKNLKAIGLTDIEIKTFLLREEVKLEKIGLLIQRGLITNVQIIEEQN